MFRVRLARRHLALIALVCALVVAAAPPEATVSASAPLGAPVASRGVAPPILHTVLPLRGFVPAPLRAALRGLRASRGFVPLIESRGALVARPSLRGTARGRAAVAPRVASADAMPSAAPLQGYTAPDPNTPDTARPVDAPSVNTVYGTFFQTGFNTRLFTATTSTPTVFGGQFAAINFNPSTGQAGCVFPAGTTPITSSARPFADVIPQQDGTCAVQTAWSPDPGRQYQAGVTTTVPLYSFQAVFTATLAIMGPGPVTFATSADDTYQLAIGPNKDNPAQQPSSVAATPTVPITAPTVGPFTGYPVMDAAYPDARGYTLQTKVTVNFPAAGLYPIEVDYVECCGDGLRLAMSASNAGGNGAGPTTSLLGDQNLVPNDCPCDATQLSVSDPVNTRTGNAWTSDTDLSVDTPGPALAWSRTYSSQEAGGGTAGLGDGWQDGYATRLITGGVTTVVSPEGNRLRFIDEGNGQFRSFPGVYDTLVRAGNVYTDTRQSRDQITFDAATGRATAITDPQGRQLLLQYNGQGQLAQITDAANTGRYLTLAYNGATIASVSDAAGRSVGYAYDGSGNLTGVTDVMGHTTTYAYGTPANHLLTGVTNALGQTVEQTTYDTAASPPRVSTQTVQDGTRVALSYAAGATTVTTTGPDGRQDTEQVQYDPNRNVMTGVVRDGVSTQQEQVDANFSPTTSTDGNGNTTATTFNRAGLPLTVTDPLSGTTSVGYDARANPVTVTDQLGRQSLAVYDASNNLTRQTTGITAGSPGLTTAYTYTVSNGRSLLTDQQTPDGVVTHYTYNASGQPVAQIVGYGASGAQETDYGYDAAGRVVTTTVGVGTPAPRVDVTRYNADDTVAATIQDYTGSGTFDPTHPDQNVTTRDGYDALGRQAAVTDTLGHVAATHYNAAGQADWTTRTLVPAQFDAQGQPIYQAFAPGQTDQNVSTLYGYDTLGRQTLVTQTGILTGTFNTATRQFSQASTRVTRTEYDALSRPVTTTLNDQPGQPVNALPDVNVQSTRQYDAQGNVTWRRDALGRWTQTQYDALNRPVTTTVNYEDGNPLTVAPGDQSWTDGHDTDIIHVTRYNADGSTAGTIDNYVTGQFAASAPITDRVTQYGYDTLGRLVTTTVNLDTNPADAGRTDVNRVSVTAYNGLTQPAGQRDALGRWTATGYDALGRATTTTQNCADGSGTPVNPVAGACASFNPSIPDRNVPTQTRYDALGRAFESVDVLGHVTHSAYDGLGQTVAITQNYVAGGAATSDTNVGTATTYDARGRVSGETDATGAATSDGYNALGQTVAVTDAVGRVTQSGYDGTGAARWSATPDGRLTVYLTDGLGRTVTTIQNYVTGVVTASTPADQDLTTRTVYDLGGRRTQSVDAAGHVTADGYDLLDQQTVLQQNAQAACAAGATDCTVTTGYQYDRAGHRIAVTDPNGHTRRFAFDAADEQTAAIDALGRATTRAYDLGGRVTVQHDPRGAADDLSYSYDGLNRLTGTAAQNLSAPIHAQYDALGRRTSLSDATGTTTVGYDAVGRTTAITAPGTGTVGYGYDATGQRTGLTYPDGLTLGYSYDPAGELQAVAQNGVRRAGYGYDAAGRLQRLARANGAITTYGYDGANRLTDQRTTVTGVQQSEFTATVNRLGQRTVVTETVGLNPTVQDTAIDTGGGVAGPFVADNAYNSGAISATAAPIDTSGVTNAAPLAVYQSERTGSSFSYNVHNLTPNGAYTVRLHFAEIDDGAAGQRRFNVSIQSTQVLTGFDIYAVAGGANRALVAAFPTTTDGGGNLYLQFTGVTGPATVSGIEIISTTASGPSPHLARATGPARRAPARATGPARRAGQATPSTAAARAAGRTAALLTAYHGLPLHFEPNAGQTDKRIAFLARGRGYGLFLAGGDATLVLLRPRDPLTITAGVAGSPPVSATVPRGGMEETAVRLRLIGARAASLVGQDRLPGAATYFTGAAPGGWHSGIATYAAVSATAVYPGVDVVYHGTQGALEYDYHLAPGTAPGVIRLGVDGVRGVALDGQGTLTLRTALGDLAQAAPSAYQDSDGRRQPVAVRYALTGPDTVGFVVGAYDHTRPLVIDPVLGYSTYLGGNGADAGNALAVDHQGDAYVVGQTASTNFITTTNAYSPSLVNGNGDVFVTKLNPRGSAVVYSTYLGGSNDDVGAGVAVDARGRAYVTGYTNSLDFPTTAGAVQRTGRGGGFDAFATALSADGSALVYSTYLSGSSDDRGNAIAVDSQGDAYIAGQTSSSDYITTTGALQPAYRGGGYDAFVTKLGPGGALVYSTYFGGTGGDVAYGIAIDGSGNAYLAGYTTSGDFPTKNAFQAVDHGNNEAFAAKLNVAGSALVYSTYLGGGSDDFAQGIAVDSQGSAYVVGRTNSGDFPTKNAFQPTDHGSDDVFVDKLTPGGDALAYGTFLGGGGDDIGYGIAADNSGKAVVTGQAVSNFPITANAPQFTYGGGGIDAFVAEVDTTLSGTASLVYSTFLGGNGEEYGYGAALDCAGNAYVTGRTSATTFITTTGGVQPGAGGGGNDAFVAKIGATRVITYAYDGVQRLTDAVECPGSTYHDGYDPASNRTSETVDGVTTRQVSYDAANQVITATTPQGTASDSYDAAGNLLSDGTSAYSYDALDRLTALAGAGAAESYGYNGDGTLVTQTVNGIPTAYTQDLAGDQSQVLQTATGAGTPTVTDYLYGLDRLASVPSGGSARTWYMPDLQGSVRYTTDDGANASPAVNYDPYGTPEGGAVPPTFGYDGELQDTATGLQNLRARTYNPATGQFLTRDPLEQQTGDAYLYAGGDPINGSDPSGQCGEYVAGVLVDEPFYGTEGTFCSAADDYLIAQDARNGTSPLLYNPTQADKDCLYAQALRISYNKRGQLRKDAFDAGVGPIRELRNGQGAGVITPDRPQVRPPSSPPVYNPPQPAVEPVDPVVPIGPIIGRLLLRVALPVAVIYYLAHPTPLAQGDPQAIKNSFRRTRQGNDRPIIVFLESEFPNIAPHIYDAIVSQGRSNILHRRRYQNDSRAIRRAAGCDPNPFSNDTGTSVGSATGQYRGQRLSSCDEYPFASSYEGGASGRSASLRGVPFDENSAQGRKVGAFYTSENIGDTGRVACGNGEYGVIAILNNGDFSPYPGHIGGECRFVVTNNS